MTNVGSVRRLWRYPVKSMLGETRDALNLDQRGVSGDRSWAVYDCHGKLGSGKSTRRFRRIDGLFRYTAAYADDESAAPWVTFPDGSTHGTEEPEVDRLLSDALGLPVRFGRETAVAHWDASPLHLVSTAAVARMRELLPDARIDERRFRPNLLLDIDVVPDEGGVSRFPEDTWVGHELCIGEARLAVAKRTERCVMVNNAQTDLGYDRRVLRTVTRVNEFCLGVYAEVLVPGTIRVGDTVRSVALDPAVWAASRGCSDRSAGEAVAAGDTASRPAAAGFYGYRGT